MTKCRLLLLVINAAVNTAFACLFLDTNVYALVLPVSACASGEC